MSKFFLSPRTLQSVWRHSAIVFDGHYYWHVRNASSDTSPIKLNTSRTGDTNLRFYITTVQDGWHKFAFLTRACFPCTIHLIMQYMGACLRMVLLTDVYRNLTSLWIKPRERAFKQFKSPVLNVLITADWVWLRIHEVSRSHTMTHQRQWDSSGRVARLSQGRLPDNTQHSQQTNVHAPGGMWANVI